MNFDNCPNCGALVPDTLPACPECGADETTGWSDKARAQQLGIPDDEDFDYEEFIDSEFGDDRKHQASRHGAHPIWIGTGILLLITFLAWLL